MKSNVAVPSYLALSYTLKSLNVSRLGPLACLAAVVNMKCGWNDTDRATQKFREKIPS
jgi:hypothetical protein